jgi:hypothetical protein
MGGIQRLVPRPSTLGPTGAASPTGRAADTAADISIHLSYEWFLGVTGLEPRREVRAR